jgi:hypothetical protein
MNRTHDAVGFWIPAVCVLATAACAAPITPGQKARDAAQEYASAVRFGRIEMAAERVSRAYRGQFTVQHSAWGSSIRVLDCELTGLALPDRDHAEAVLSVTWQRVDEAETRTTRLAQHWRERSGSWTLEGEERTAGDVGLLAEPNVLVARPARVGGVQFESITIGRRTPP